MTTALVGYYEGDHLRLRYRANAAPNSLDAFILYEDEDRPGIAFKDTTPQITTFTTTWAETLVEGDTSGGASSCKITGGGVLLRASATSLVRGSLYVRLVLARQESAYEECLCCGYIYDAKPFLSVGEHGGPEMSEAVAYMDVTYTQANVAGGAVVVEVLPGAGNSFEVLAARAVNSGTNAVRLETRGAAGGTVIVRYRDVSSGAAAQGAIPKSEASTATGSLADSTRMAPVSGTQVFAAMQTGAGAQNDTFQVLMLIRVKGALPTVSKANSTNQADVSVTAGADSFTFLS